MKKSPRTAPTVLVVEENRRLNELLGHCLSQAGYHVLAADSGLAAVALVSSSFHRVIDVLLTQPRGSIMGGLNLARWMHQLHPQLKYLALAGAPAPLEAFPCQSVPMPLREGALLSGLHSLLSSPSRAAGSARTPWNSQVRN